MTIDETGGAAPPAGGGGSGGSDGGAPRGDRPRRRRRRRRGGGAGAEAAPGATGAAGADEGEDGPDDVDSAGEGAEARASEPGAAAEAAETTTATASRDGGPREGRGPQRDGGRGRDGRDGGGREARGRGGRGPQEARDDRGRGGGPQQRGRGGRPDENRGRPEGARSGGDPRTGAASGGGEARRERGPGRGERGPRPRDERPRGERPRDERPRDERRAPATATPAPAAAAAPSPAAALAPPPDFDDGWSLDELSASGGSATAAAAEAAEPAPPPPPVAPPVPEGPITRFDPDGDHVFVDLTVEDVAPGVLVNLVGVKFRDAGTIHPYDAGELALRRGDRVIVESDRGPSLATVAVASRRRPFVDPLRRVIRRASAADEATREKNVTKERDAFLFTKERIRARGLPMKLVRVELPQTNAGKTVVLFASEERVDFRDLVRDLTQELRGRIEMRQIGARDEAKVVGGIGACGRELCCSTWLPAFVPISIKMAKDQGLPLNPSKVSGQCGRLKCCLVYEQDTYKEMRKGLPKVGKKVQTPGGVGRVVELDVLRRKVRVVFEEGGAEVFPGDVVTPLFPSGGGPGRAPTADADGDDGPDGPDTDDAGT